MWLHEESIEITATPAQIWRLFVDVPGWKSWNAGIEQIELHGPFAAGSSFTMQPPGTDVFVSTLTYVVENECFVDETIIDDTHVVVEHRLHAQPSGRTQVTYSTRITGPGAAKLGPLVTGDFREVLVALKHRVEQP